MQHGSESGFPIITRRSRSAGAAVAGFKKAQAASVNKVGIVLKIIVGSFAAKVRLMEEVGR